MFRYRNWSNWWNFLCFLSPRFHICLNKTVKFSFKSGFGCWNPSVLWLKKQLEAFLLRNKDFAYGNQSKLMTSSVVFQTIRFKNHDGRTTFCCFDCSSTSGELLSEAFKEKTILNLGIPWLLKSRLVSNIGSYDKRCFVIEWTESQLWFEVTFCRMKTFEYENDRTNRGNFKGQNFLKIKRSKCLFSAIFNHW